MDGLDRSQLPQGFKLPGEARMGDPVPGKPGMIYMPVVDLGGRYRPIHEVANIVGQITQHTDAQTIRDLGDRHLGEIGLAPVHQDDIQRVHGMQLAREEQRGEVERLRREAAALTEAVDAYAQVEDVPHPGRDSHQQIVGDELGTQYKANIRFHHARVMSSLAEARARILGDIQRAEDASRSSLGQAGQYAANSVAAQAAKGTEVRLGNLDEHEINETLQAKFAAMREEANQKYAAAEKLADDFQAAANNAVDWTKANPGRNLAEEFEQVAAGFDRLSQEVGALNGQLETARADLGKAQGTVRTQQTEIEGLEGKVGSRTFQRNVAIGLFVVALLGLALAGAYIMRSGGHTPLQSGMQNWLQGLSTQQLNMLKLGGIVVASVGVGAVGIFGVVKGGPLVLKGVKRAGNAVKGAGGALVDAIPFQMKQKEVAV